MSMLQKRLDKRKEARKAAHSRSWATPAGEAAGSREQAVAAAGPDGAGAEVLYERRGAAAVVTIDRQERRNAVDGPTAAALHEAFLRFEADETARVMILTGAGGVSFCAGADLKATETMAPRLMSEEGPMGFTRLTASKPTIAAVSGFCLAGGLELALWCDLRIATEDSRFGYPERRWGVPLIDGGTQRLPRIVGLGRALDLILTGRIIDAVEADSMGLVTELVAPGAHLDRALELAEGLAGFPQRRCWPTAGPRSRGSACRWRMPWPWRPRRGPRCSRTAPAAPSGSPPARAAAGPARAPSNTARLVQGRLSLRWPIS